MCHAACTAGPMFCGGIRDGLGLLAGRFYPVASAVWPGMLADRGDGLALNLHYPPTHAEGLE